MARPSTTVNRLHFEDLDPKRFEDLCLSLVYRLGRWQTLNHYGRKGADGGVDIHAVEELENQLIRRWYVQVKRYKSIGRAELTAVVEEVVAHRQTKPDILLLVVACDVTRKNIDHFAQLARKKGISRAEIWVGSVIEARLYAAHHDLLWAFFGVSLTSERRDRIASLRRRIDLGRRIRRDFCKDDFDAEEWMRKPWVKMSYEQVLIRSIDDTTYPTVSRQPGISPWFKVHLYDFYHNGLEVLLTNRTAIFAEDNSWDLLGHNDPREQKYRHVRVHEIGRIPFEHIVDYDLHVDEYGYGPHVYCDFRNGGQPYEDIVYATISVQLSNGQYTPNTRLDNGRRLALA